MTIPALVHIAALFLPMLCGADLPTARPLTRREFDALATRCAPGAPVSTLRAIVRVESAFNSLALSINYPEKAGPELGVGKKSVQLARQPHNLVGAIEWTHWLLSHGQTVSVGLMQLNSEHFPALNVTLEQAFDTCTNVRTGWVLFSTKFEHARMVFGSGRTALRAALSSYNAGVWTAGYANGYVEKVIGSEAGRTVGLMPPTRTGPDNGEESDLSRSEVVDPNEAPTKIRWQENH